MLEKMGWNEGEGLGREGAGRREPVSKNNLYTNLRTYAKRGVNYLATMYEPLFQWFNALFLRFLIVFALLGFRLEFVQAFFELYLFLVPKLTRNDG